MLIYNALYHMGKIYTSIENVVYLITNIETIDADGWEDIGRDIGRVFYQLFYNIGDYEYPDISIDYPEEFLETWK